MKKLVVFIAMITFLIGSCSPELPAKPAPAAGVETIAPELFSTTTSLPATLTPASTSTVVKTSPFSISSAPAPTFTPNPPLVSGQVLSLTGIHMVAAGIGWGIESNGHIVRTTDGGSTWQEVTPDGGAYDSGGFFALDSETAWATPFGHVWSYQFGWTPYGWQETTVWRTVDGGLTWEPTHLCLGGDCDYAYGNSPEVLYTRDMQFLDENTGWFLIVVSHGMHQDHYRVYQTTDGGKNWTMTVNHLGGPIVFSATGLAFLDRNTGWLSVDNIESAFDPGTEPNINKSVDAGFTWDYLSLPSPVDLPEAPEGSPNWCGTIGIDAAPSGILEATVRCRFGEGDARQFLYYSYRSLDGGDTWSSWRVTGYGVLDLTTGRRPVRAGAFEFLDTATGWRLAPAGAGGSSQIHKTSDAGRTWSIIATVDWESAQIEFIDPQSGWAIVVNNDQTSLFRTTDGGFNWQALSPVIGP